MVALVRLLNIRAVIVALLLSIVQVPMFAADSPSPPVIVTGWDSPHPDQYRRHLAEFERLGMFDGTSIKPTRKTNGGIVECLYAFSRDPWQWEEFTEAVNDLRAVKPTTCRETFLMLYANPGDVDWFDDVGWREIVNHWRLLTRLAKQGDLRGVLYDAEPYSKPFSQFRYSSQPGRNLHSFAEYQTKARERGREVMKAVVEEFPRVSILTYRLFSDLLPLLDSGDLGRALESNAYGLQPAFVDGWMDALPLGLTIIEGTEDIGYRANSSAEYNAAFTVQRLRLKEFLSFENREAFSRCLRIGQSLYLDAYASSPGDTWHIDSTGSTPAHRLTANLNSALAASDGVIWLYGEKARWWPGEKVSDVMWPDKLAGVVDAIRQAKAPKSYARDYLNSRRAEKNLIPNSHFAKDQQENPDGWFTWKAVTSQGTVTLLDDHLVISGAEEMVVGCIIQVAPGDIVALHLKVRCIGKGLGSLAIGWKSKDGTWTAREYNGKYFPVGDADEAGWREIVQLKEVPLAADRIVFMLSASAQESERDRCEFSDTELVKVR